VGTPLGRESYEHYFTLSLLGHFLQRSRQPADAEGWLRQALEVIEVLIAQESGNTSFHRDRGATLANLGDVLADQGKYLQAREEMKSL
jgi:hypothetical protein